MSAKGYFIFKKFPLAVYVLLSGARGTGYEMLYSNVDTVPTIS